MKEIKHWLSLDDDELGLLQYFVTDYVQQNKFSVVEAFELGVISTNIQFMMRKIKDVDNFNALSYINIFEKYNGIGLFLKQKLITYFDNLDVEKRYDYLYNDVYKTSYFNRTEEENSKLEEEFLKKITDKCYSKYGLIV